MKINNKDYLLKRCKNFEHQYSKFCSVSARYYDENRYLFGNREPASTESSNNLNILISATSQEYVIKRVELLIEFYILKELLSKLDIQEQDSYIDIVFTYIENIGLDLGFYSYSKLESYNNDNLKGIKQSLIDLKKEIENSETYSDELSLGWLKVAKNLIKEKDCISIAFDGVRFASKINKIKQSYWFVDHYKKYMFYGEAVRILFLCYLNLITLNNSSIDKELQYKDDGKNNKLESNKKTLNISIDEFIDNNKLWKII